MMTEPSNDVQPCMGGFCSVRDRCPHYRSDSIASPSERLCPKNADGTVPGFRPVLVRTIDNKQEFFP